MLKYILKRLVLLIPILIGVSFIIFFIMELTPGDPVIRILGAEASTEAKEQLRVSLGLDKPFLVRYVEYLTNVVFHLDFGISWRTQKPVFDEILPRLPVTFTIATLSIVFSTLVGVPLGVYSAVKQNTLGDNLMRVFSTIFVALPNFWFAMLLILLFALELRWLPASGLSGWKSYVMPVIATAGANACRFLRITRSTMLECIREDYVRTARAKGVPNRKVIYRHALQNAMLPVITTIGSSFGLLLGGTVIGESVFSLPGLGTLVVLSIRSMDTPTVVACVLLVAVFVTVVNLLVDVIYAILDPRIKGKFVKRKKRSAV